MGVANQNSAAGYRPPAPWSTREYPRVSVSTPCPYNPRRPAKLYARAHAAALRTPCRVPRDRLARRPQGVPRRYPLVLHGRYNGTGPAPPRIQRNRVRVARTAGKRRRKRRRVRRCGRRRARRQVGVPGVGRNGCRHCTRAQPYGARAAVRYRTAAVVRPEHRRVLYFALGTRRGADAAVSTRRVPHREISHAPECTPWRDGPPCAARPVDRPIRFP